MNLNDLFKLREQLEDLNADQTGGLNAYLTAAGFTVFTRINALGEWQKNIPRIELKVEIGSATGHRTVTDDGKLRFDYFSFNVAIQAVTRPRNNPDENILHENFVAAVRAVISGIGGHNTKDDLINFPNVFIAEVLKDTGTSDYLKEDNGIEYTTLSYAGIVGIRPQAWNN